jgi:hypothetical protein
MPLAQEGASPSLVERYTGKASLLTIFRGIRALCSVLD